MTMKTSGILIVVAQILPAIALGYILHGWQNRTERACIQEELASEESFSEVENAKVALRGLSTEFLAGLYTVPSLPALRPNAGASGPAGDSAQIAGAIRYLEEGISEFKGTEQELLVVRCLLGLLRTNHDQQHWLDLYLQVLYEHPTDPMVSQLAQQALRAARDTARERQLLDAFRQLNRIPFDFGGKEQVNELLSEGSGLANAEAEKQNSGHRL